MVNWKKKFLCMRISNLSFTDTEQLCKMWISSHVFFKDFVERFRTAYFKNRSFSRYFSRILFVDFRIALYLKTGLSQRYFWRILIIDLQTFIRKIIHLNVHLQKYWNALVLIFLIFYHLEIPSWTCFLSFFLT